MKALSAININIIPTYFNVASIPAPSPFIHESQSAFQMLFSFQQSRKIAIIIIIPVSQRSHSKCILSCDLVKIR